MNSNISYLRRWKFNNKSYSIIIIFLIFVRFISRLEGFDFYEIHPVYIKTGMKYLFCRIVTFIFRLRIFLVENNFFLFAFQTSINSMNYDRSSPTSNPIFGLRVCAIMPNIARSFYCVENHSYYRTCPIFFYSEKYNIFL